MGKWGIRSRVLFLALTPAAAIAIVLASYFIHTQISHLERSLVERGNTLAHQLAPASEFGVITANTDLLTNLAEAALQEAGANSITITTASGVELVKVVNTRRQERHGAHTQTFRAPILQSEITVSDFDSLLFGDAPAHKPHILGWVSIELSHFNTSQLQRRVFIDSVVITVLGLVLSALLALRMSRDVINPIFRLNHTVKQLRDGRLEARADTGSGGELGALEQGINTMASALQDMHEQMQSKVDASTAELRKALESMELQNAELDAARKQALEASRVKSEFMANMSHEIRTPMNGIIGFTNLLGKTPLNREQREHVNTIRESTASLMTVINDILDFTKIASGDLRLDSIRFNLRDIIEDAVTNLAPCAYEKGLELILMFYSDVPRSLQGDPARVRQVATNLIANAIKFTQKGNVIVRVMLEEEHGSQVAVKISVQDTGIGLSLRDQKRLVSAFSQTDTSATRKFGGIGIGLVICKKLVEYMRGDIGLESQLGKGSTFWFTFSCTRQTRPRTAAPPGNPLRSLKCLLYEQNRLSRLALHHHLAEWGLDIRDTSRPEDLLIALNTPAPGDLDRRLVVLGLTRGEIDTGAFAAYLAQIQDPGRYTFVVLANTHDRNTLGGIEAQGAHLALPKMVRHEDFYNSLCSTLFRPPQAAAGLGTDQDSGSADRALDLSELEVLIVDDNKINRKLVSTLYQLQGASVTEAENGEVATRLVAAGQFDLIFMDIHMPVMSGIDATAKIRAMEQAGHRTPIIALTANAMRGERDRLIRSGLDDCLIKPMQEEDLWAMTLKWVPPGRLKIRPHWALPQDATADLLERTQDAPVPPTAPSPEDPALLDRAQAVRIAGGSAELADELFTMLVEELPEMKARLNRAFASDSLGAIEAEAHKIHGAALYCAARNIKLSAERLEKASIRKNLDDIPACHAQLTRDIDELLATQA